MSTETAQVPQEDPDSPAARARRDAEAAWKEAYGRDPNDPPAGDPPPSDPPPSDPPPVEPAPRTELHLRQPGDRPADPAPAPAPDGDDSIARLEAQHAAEMRKALDTIAGMRGNIDQLRGQVDLLARQRHVADPVPVREEPAAPRLVTDEEAKAYGTDLLDVVGRRAQEVYEPTIGRLLQRVEGLEAQLAGMGRHVVQSAQMTLGQVLTQQVGRDWATQNTDPEFIAWLQGEDPVSGFNRQQLLITARDSGNAVRVAHLFNAYRRETGKYEGAPATASTAITPPSDGGQPAPAGTGGRTGKVPLTSLVAPGRSRSPAPAPAGGDEIALMTEDEINAHYRLRTLNQVKPEERKAFDARLAAAMAAGKVEVRPKH
jgi:hypothetical protein